MPVLLLWAVPAVIVVGGIARERAEVGGKAECLRYGPASGVCPEREGAAQREQQDSLDHAHCGRTPDRDP